MSARDDQADCRKFRRSDIFDVRFEKHRVHVTFEMIYRNQRLA